MKTIEPVKELAGMTGLASRYEFGSPAFNPIPLFNRHEETEFELDLFALGSGDYRTVFFAHVVSPIERAWAEYKSLGPEAAIELCSEIESPDWRQACTEWMLRCAKKRSLKKAQDDGVNYETK